MNESGLIGNGLLACEEKNHLAPTSLNQGDQTGRNFAHAVMFYFGQSFLN
jgi:hypothetical protein